MPSDDGEFQSFRPRSIRSSYQRLTKWRSASVDRRIFLAAVTVGSLMAIFALATFLQELVVAHRFGAGDRVDAFVLALVVPAFVALVVADAFTAAFVPTYIEVGELEGREAANALFSSIVFVAFVLLLVLLALMAAFAPFILGLLTGGFDEDKAELTKSLFYLLLPIIPLSGVTTIWGSTLYAGERFALATLARAAVPLTATAAVLGFAQQGGIQALAIGVVGGYVLQALLLARILRAVGLPLKPCFRGINPSLRRVASQWGPMVWGTLIMGGTRLVDNFMASWLEPGSVAALHYGNRVPMLITGISATALGTAVFPHFSRLVAMREWESLRRSAVTYARLIAAVTVPFTLALMLASEPLVRILFERGAFTAKNTAAVAAVQAMLLLQVPFYLVGILLARLAAALKVTRILMWGAIISFLVNISFNYLLMTWIGVAGIALSTAIVYALATLFVGSLVVRTLREHLA